jgi:CubicO group peptidase (beta-lactamase class C family)
MHCRAWEFEWQTTMADKNDLTDATTALPRTRTVLRAGVDAGLHIGAQVYVSRRGNVIADFAIGESRPGVPMTTDTLMVWLSATKPLTAVAIGQLWEQGKLDIQDPVARHVPEFAQNGKESVTVWHLLTHTCGIRWLDTGWPQTPWEQIIARICAMPMERGWVPGEKAGYHATTSWFILGEIVQRLGGMKFSDYVREEICLPFGMNDSWIGMPAEQYDQYGDRLGILQQTEKGQLKPLAPWNMREAVTHCRPAANGHGPIRELGRFYEMLLAGGRLPGGPRILQPQTVTALTSRQRIGMFDQTFRHVIDWGLGFIINSNRHGADTVPYGFGVDAGESTFGHNGFQSSTAFADPEHKLVVAVVCNGACGDAAHDRRMREIDAAIYADLRQPGSQI